MKTKMPLLITCIVSMLLLANATAFSQQAGQMLPRSALQKTTAVNNDNSSYSYKLYTAPCNMFGYDIYANGKPVYHQFVLMVISKEGKHIVATKPQAEKAARLAIDKIKTGQSPLLSGEELQKIIAL